MTWSFSTQLVVDKNRKRIFILKHLYKMMIKPVFKIKINKNNNEYVHTSHDNLPLSVNKTKENMSNLDLQSLKLLRVYMVSENILYFCFLFVLLIRRMSLCFYFIFYFYILHKKIIGFLSCPFTSSSGFLKMFLSNVCWTLPC